MAVSPQTDNRADERQLASAAARVARDWKISPYYEIAERGIERQWTQLVWPFLTSEQEGGIDFSTTMELAAGHGRNSDKLLPLTDKLHLVDVNAENISFLRTRFGNNPKVEYHINNGYSLSSMADGVVSFVYCFDSMVHFDSDVVRSYLREFARILIPGGRVFVHHSNYVGNPGGDVHNNPAWRNFMSKELFAHYAKKEGLKNIRQKEIDWQCDKSFIDCFTLLGSI
jgi:SAM-dependent methyltransferase